MKIKRIQTKNPEKTWSFYTILVKANRGNFLVQRCYLYFFDNFDSDPVWQLLFPDTKVSDPYWIRRSLFIHVFVKVLRMSKTLQNINIGHDPFLFCSNTVFLLQRICLSEGERHDSWQPGNQLEQQPRSLRPAKHQPVKTNHKTIS
jgi:hypothetical protein